MEFKEFLSFFYFHYPSFNSFQKVTLFLPERRRSNIEDNRRIVDSYLQNDRSYRSSMTLKYAIDAFSRTTSPRTC